MSAWKRALVAATLVLGSSPAWPACDRCTADATITTLYEAISVAPGVAWDWPRVRALFVPEGLLASTHPSRREGLIVVSGLDALVRRTEAAFAGKGFIEREYRRKTFIHGDMASIGVFSLSAAAR